MKLVGKVYVSKNGNVLGCFLSVDKRYIGIKCFGGSRDGLRSS